MSKEQINKEQVEQVEQVEKIPTTKELILKRCEGKNDESYISMTVKELKEISKESPNLADHAPIYKLVKQVKELCK